MFSELGVKVATGQCFLEGCVGDRESIEEYVEQWVQQWVHHVKLTNEAKSQPQAAYAALTESLQFESTCSMSFQTMRLLVPLSHILLESFHANSDGREYI